MKTGNFSEHLKLTLADRKPRLDNELDFFRSAVLIPLVESREGVSVLFERRSAELKWQPGEICFPGGKIEQYDQDPADTAVRETMEELGVTRECVEIIGPMDFIASPLGVLIYPFVGYLTDITGLQPNQGEVGEVFRVPLSFLLQTRPMTAHMELATRPMSDFPFTLLDYNYSSDWKRRKTYPVQFYHYQDYVIWGLTAKILDSFLAICRNGQ